MHLRMGQSHSQRFGQDLADELVAHGMGPTSMCDWHRESVATAAAHCSSTVGFQRCWLNAAAPITSHHITIPHYLLRASFVVTSRRRQPPLDEQGAIL